MIKAVLFDWDGTLYNIIDFLVDTYTEVFEELGMKPWRRDDYRTRFRNNWRLMLPELGLVEHEEFLLKRWDENLAKNPLPLYEGAKQTIEKLKEDYRLGLVTSAPKEKLGKELQRFGLSQVFDSVVAWEDTQQKKPNPEPLLKALAQMGIQPEEAVYVGDMVEDIKAAQACGMPNIAVTWGLHNPDKLRAIQPDLLVDDFAELKKAIQKLR